MKMKWYDRVLVALSGLLLTALGFFLFLAGVGVPSGPYNWIAKASEVLIGPNFTTAVRSGQWYIIVFFLCLGVLLMAWGIRLLVVPFLRARREDYFSAPNIEHGSLKISLQALEHLITKSLVRHPQLTDNRVRISGNEEAIRVRLHTVMQTGVHIPKVTQQVREDIANDLMTCAGITVSDVDIVVEDTKPGPDLPQLADPQAGARAVPAPVVSEVVPYPGSGQVPVPEAPEDPEESEEPEETQAMPQEAPMPEKLTELDIEAELAKVDAEGDQNG